MYKQIRFNFIFKTIFLKRITVTHQPHPHHHHYHHQQQHYVRANKASGVVGNKGSLNAMLPLTQTFLDPLLQSLQPPGYPMINNNSSVSINIQNCGRNSHENLPGGNHGGNGSIGTIQSAIITNNHHKSMWAVNPLYATISGR